MTTPPPVKLAPAVPGYDQQGRLCSITAGGEDFVPGQYAVVATDRTGVAAARRAAEEELSGLLEAARQKWHDAGGRKRFDELSAHLNRADTDFVADAHLAEVYSRDARQATRDLRPPEEVVRLQRLADAKKELLPVWAARQKMLRAMLAEEADVCRRGLASAMSEARAVFRQRHREAAAQALAEAEAALAGPYFRHACSQAAAEADSSAFDRLLSGLDLTIPDPPRMAPEREPVWTGGGVAAAVA
jgi:hypothetical protein